MCFPIGKALISKLNLDYSDLLAKKSNFKSCKGEFCVH